MRDLNAALRDIPLPARMRSRPVSSTGYPVPWFVAQVDGSYDDFRVADAAKVPKALRLDLCWVCGQTLGRFKCFVIGPMCSVNRVTTEPPCHRECAEYAVRACPFLTRPRMRRNETDLPDGHTNPAGVMIKRNPGVALIWISKSYRVVRDRDTRGSVIMLDEPVEIQAWCAGRLATRDELDASINSGLPLLAEVAEQDGPEGVAMLAQASARADKLIEKFLPRPGTALPV